MYASDPSSTSPGDGVVYAGPLILGVPWSVPSLLVRTGAELAAVLEVHLVCAYVDLSSVLTVVLMCGLPGAGKTTYAKTLERTGHVRLSVDEEMWRQDRELAARFDTPEYFDFTVRVERQLRTRLTELIADGRDVVVDLSFWSRQRREEYKALITAHGAAWQLVYFGVPREELLRRLARRKLRPGPNSAPVGPAYLDKFIAGFEPPVNEGEKVIQAHPRHTLRE